MEKRFLDAVFRAGPDPFLRSFRPVVGVIGDADDDFLRGDNFADLAEVFHEPILGSDGAGRRGQPMLVVVHQDDGVALLAEEFVVVGIIARGEGNHELQIFRV